MGSFIIYLTSFLIILILSIRNIRNKNLLILSIRNITIEINKTYKELFKEKSILAKICPGGLVLSAEFFSFLIIFTGITKHLNTYFNGIADLIIKLFAILISFLIMHYAVGYILLISSKIHLFLNSVENKNLKIDFILSYFIISTFLAVLLIFPKEFSKHVFVGLVTVSICYLLNLRILLNLTKNPHNIKTNEENETSFSRMIIAAVLLLFILVLNLYLGVCFIASLDTNAYLNAQNYFDLFYYTIITFTTIGYGDIIPVSIPAKILAIIISITSVVCLTVFLSTILSYKDQD
ncbi:MAG: potassium channel family protein [Paraclostridium sp.]